MLEKEVGNRLRLTRRQKGLRLKDVALTSGFSAGLLSKIESGKVSSPISTLDVIAKALGTSFEQIVANDIKAERTRDVSAEVSIVRKNERAHCDVVHDGFVSKYEWLTLGLGNRLMEPFIFTLPQEHGPTVYSHHPGQEMIFVLEGSVFFDFRRQSFLLEEGDCAYFDASVAHRVRNARGGEPKVLCIRSTF